ncbi:MAG: hypothetical protein IJ767_07300 [Bacteroidaceae bacterium]|nr:hypothetical protein [Bacteroidaceae bacterium]
MDERAYAIAERKGFIAARYENH